MDGYGESSAAMAAGTDNILDLVDIDAPEAVPKAIDELFASAGGFAQGQEPQALPWGRMVTIAS